MMKQVHIYEPNTRVKDLKTGRIGNAIEMTGVVIMARMDGNAFNSFYSIGELRFL